MVSWGLAFATALRYHIDLVWVCKALVGFFRAGIYYTTRSVSQPCQHFPSLHWPNSVFDRNQHPTCPSWGHQQVEQTFVGTGKQFGAEMFTLI